MLLRTGYLVLAHKLQESGMMHGDVAARLTDAVNDAHRGTGSWGSYINHDGDGETGNVVYSSGGDIRSAPYEIGEVDGKSTTSIDTANSKNVVPVTSYQEEAEDSDHYTAMGEAFRASNIYTDLPLYERFISKDTRKSMSADDFAGKNRSFPISTQADVDAAFHSLGRAGSDNYSVATIRANIIRIAKRKGLSLPKSAQESARETVESGTLRLVESIDWAQEESIALMESAGTVEREIKIIKPGPGASAIYPAEVLKRDGPKVFTKGTHMYINHATEAEKKARPEGDWNNLAGSLSSDAYWKESDKRGAGLYAMATFAPDIAPAVIAKAPWSGVSINANGNARMEAGRPVIKNGLRELAELTSCESIDIVTRAGAGGMILTEAAGAANSEEVEMTDEQIAKLVEGTVVKVLEAHRPAANADPSVKMLLERAIRGDATVEANRILAPLKLRDSAKQLVVDNVLRFGELPMKEGALDTVKFGELVTAESKRVATALGDYPGVRNMGGSGGIELVGQTAEQRLAEATAQKALAKDEFDDAVKVYRSLGLSEAEAKRAAEGRDEEAA